MRRGKPGGGACPPPPSASASWRRPWPQPWRRPSWPPVRNLDLEPAVHVGDVLRSLFEPPPAIRLTDGGGFMGAGHMDMSCYMEMFMRRSEINRVVEDIPGGVRTTTESKAPDLTAQLQAHVSSMYTHLDQGTEVVCMSQSLPLFSVRPAATAAS